MDGTSRKHGRINNSLACINSPEHKWRYGESDRKEMKSQKDLDIQSKRPVRTQQQRRGEAKQFTRMKKAGFG